MDPFLKAGLTAFFVSALLGCVAYALASFLAWWFFANPRHIYISRLVFLLGFVLLVMIFNTPDFVFSGPRDRWLPVLVKLEGANYGTLSLFMWLIIALIKYPKADPPKASKQRSGGGSLLPRDGGAAAPPDEPSV